VADPYRQVLIAVALVIAPAWSTGWCELPSSAEPELASASGHDRHVLVTFTQKAPRRLQRAGSTPRAYGGRSAYKASSRVKRAAAKIARTYGLRRVDEWPIEVLGVHCVVYELAPEQSSAELLERLAGDPRIESAQPMQIFKVLTESYNDPYLALQHGVRSMQIEQAHLWARGRGIKVAVVDTGVDVNHPELESSIETAEDFVGESSQAFTSDIHGTAVVGVIAAAADNGIGIVGVAPSVEILALKACWQQEARSAPALCNSFTLAKAISFAIDRRPDVLNLSLAGPRDPLLSRLLSRAIDKGIVVVGAADPESRLRSGFPAAVSHVIVVSATAAEEPGLRGSVAVVPGLSAPGREILTTTPHGAYDFLSGSSLAAAHVSGLAALLLERNKRLSADEILALLNATAGTGLNACAALSRLLRSESCPTSSAVPTASG
jgi:subtilisin family serine protease